MNQIARQENKSTPQEIRYKKPLAVQELQKLIKIKIEEIFPDNPSVAKIILSDDITEGLTDCIVTYITLFGGSSKHMIDSIINQETGEEQIMGDVFAEYCGRFLHIEVNFWGYVTKVRREMRTKHRSMGGLFFQARNFTEFKDWLDSLTQKKADHE